MNFKSYSDLKMLLQTFTTKRTTEILPHFKSIFTRNIRQFYSDFIGSDAKSMYYPIKIVACQWRDQYKCSIFF